MIETDCPQNPMWSPVQIIVYLLTQRLQQLLPVEITKFDRKRTEP
jgi:hypothetical protein